MFRARTLWVSSQYISNSRFPKDMHIFGLLEVEIGKTIDWRNTYRGVDLNTTRFVLGGFSCTNSPLSYTWRKVMNGYTRTFFSLPKHHIRICRAFRNFSATYCSKHDRFTLFETCSVGYFTTFVILSRPDPMNCLAKWLDGSRSQEFNVGFRNSLVWFPANIKWKRPKQRKLRLQIWSCQSWLRKSTLTTD